jgi:toxin HigB-1
MIVSFRHKGLEKFFETGSAKGIQASHQKRIRLQLAALDSATDVEDMRVPSYRLHELHGDRKGIWSIFVNGNWRITFKFTNGNASVVDYEDYH